MVDRDNIYFRFRNVVIMMPLRGVELMANPGARNLVLSDRLYKPLPRMVCISAGVPEY